MNPSGLKAAADERAVPAGRLALTAICSVILTLVGLTLTLRLDRVDLCSPLNYLRDANIFLLRAKSIVEGNWVWHNPRIGMPFGADLRDFPMNITLDSAIMWLLSRFTDSPVLIVNLTWIIAICLAAALACYAFVRLGFKLVFSAAFGTIFALLPYTYFRGTQHLHSVYYAVPLIALAAIELVRGAPKLRAATWMGGLLAGLAYTYTAFFSVFVLLVAGIIGSLRLRKLRPLALAGALAGVVTGITVVDLSPSLIFWMQQGRNAKMLFKSPAEAELYALKIRYLVTPVPDHPIPALRVAEAKLAMTKYPLTSNENEWGRLGTVGSIGFLYLIVFALGAAVSPRFLQSRAAAIAGPAAALTLLCVLFASVGGFGDFFSTFISPDIRCYARIFPFIGFFSLLGAATLLAPFDTRLPSGFQVPVWTVIALLAAYDQAVPSFANDQNQAVYRQDADFLRYVDGLLPPDSAVFELPYTDFPNEILPANLLTNDLLRPYLHSTKLRWSWPAVSGTTSAEWSRVVSALPPQEMLRAIVQRGFSGLWLDSSGYSAGTSPESAITAELGADPRRNPGNRFLFYDLRARAAALKSAEVLALDPVQVVFERGFYYEEHNLARSWRWSLRHGRITLINPLSVKREISLSVQIQTAAPGPHTIRLKWGNTQAAMHAAEHQDITVDLEPLQVVPIDLECDCPAVRPPGSARSLYFYVSDLRVTDVAVSH